MEKQLSRRAVLSGLLASAAGAATANPLARSLRPHARPDGAAAPIPDFDGLRPKARDEDLILRLAPPAEELIAEARLGGHVSYSVVDVKTGLVLEEHDTGTTMPPASVAKALTALYALETLGPEHRFETQVLATATPKDGVLDGDLVLAGGGDPTLDTDSLAALAQKLKDSGLREVRGRFLVWGGALTQVPEIDPDQPDQVGYNPAVSGLNLNFNRVHFQWTKAGSNYTVAMDARSAKYRPEVSVARMQVSTRGSPVYTYDDRGGRDEWTVARGALGTGGSRWLPMRKPEIYAGEVFQTFARSQGIVLKAPESAGARPSGPVLARQQSAPLREIARDMLLYSTNLTAEVLGVAATTRRTGRVPATLRASAAAMNSWAREVHGMQGTELVDHSGLGADSRVSTASLATLLARVAQSDLPPLLKDIAIRDDQGRPQPNHPIQVVAKTGTLNFVSCLAGYATGPDGTQMAFAIFTANMDERAGIPPEDRERPAGSSYWNARSKRLQQALIQRWSFLYAT
ncbi:D-alanyl-D-alanine carboxypeptidase/D-alanyl-D-alanine-endopeptidase [Mesobacterium pallidum]|uniref:D-alanyl-D-alanine carboxypeptidase/D-alanyl-D-alanine endopeptidase n=1 Tax=Mesobacterium pallidum TaxID=2872037 RepID=UPI003AB927D6